MKFTSSISVRRNQHGRGKMGCFFTFLVLGGMGYLGYKFLPAYMTHFELKDALDEVAVYKFAGLGQTKGTSEGRGGTQEIEEIVINKARELGVKLNRDNIKVERTPDKIYIHVNYSAPVQLPTGLYEMKFDFTSHN